MASSVPGPETLDQHLGPDASSCAQDLQRLRVAQIHRHAALVATIDPPPGVQRPSVAKVLLPVPQRISARRLDLDHVGAVVRQLQRQHVAGHQPGQVDHAQALQHAMRRRVGRRPSGMIGAGHQASVDLEVELANQRPARAGASWRSCATKASFDMRSMPVSLAVKRCDQVRIAQRLADRRLQPSRHIARDALAARRCRRSPRSARQAARPRRAWAHPAATLPAGHR